MSNKKILISVIAVVVLIIVLLFLGRPSASRQVDQPLTGVAGTMMVSGSPMYDFGTVSMAKGPVMQKFTVQNSGAAPVMMKKMYTSCMCTTATMMKNGQRMGPFGMPGHGGAAALLNQTLEAGESMDIEVTFDPAAHGPAGIGSITRSVFIEQASLDSARQGGESPLELQISANVTP